MDARPGFASGKRGLGANSRGRGTQQSCAKQEAVETRWPGGWHPHIVSRERLSLRWGVRPWIVLPDGPDVPSGIANGEGAAAIVHGAEFHEDFASG